MTAQESPPAAECTADRLLRLTPEIVLRWEQLCRSEVPAAADQTKPALQDNMPDFLGNLAIRLRPPLGRPGRDERPEVCHLHGEERASLGGYDLRQVIYEYRLLRKVIFDVLNAELPVPLADQTVIHDQLDTGIQEAATAFIEARQGELKAKARQLECQAEELRLVDQRKNHFLAMLAHELRTPLSVVSNALYVLEGLELQEPRARRQLTMAARQSANLARLISELTDTARAVNGQLQLERHPLDLVELVTATACALRPLVEDRDLRFEVMTPRSPVVVLGDAQRLEQVINNLVMNAAKHTDAGGFIWLAVSTEGTGAFLRVRDTGRGIQPEMLDEIFQLFHQVEPGRHGADGGLGLGLALVQKLVELHEGTVSASSPGLGHGTEFTVTLPLHTPTAP